MEFLEFFWVKIVSFGNFGAFFVSLPDLVARRCQISNARNDFFSSLSLIQLKMIDETLVPHVTPASYILYSPT